MKCDQSGSFQVGCRHHLHLTKCEVPHYDDLLSFIDLQAQASETSLPTPTKKFSRIDSSSSKKASSFSKTFTTNSGVFSNRCILYILYMPAPNLRLCLTMRLPVHELLQQWPFHQELQVCKKCQHSHHTLLDMEPHSDMMPAVNPSSLSQVISHTAVRLKSSSLLTTC